MTIDPVELVLRVSAKSIGACEVPANTNAGPYVERVLGRVGLKKGAPWCAAEVCDTGIIALDDAWPLPHTGSCQQLYDFAQAHRLVEQHPQRGDVFVIWHGSLGRFAHTGFVVAVGTPCTTHEGNTSGGVGPGSREGWIKAEKSRTFTPKDRFIRWSRLLSIGA